MTSMRSPQNNPILMIFTDLDGTLLDSSYSYEMALPALKLVSKGNIPLIICSSKTRAEIEVIRKDLGNNHPFVSENGGGIYISKNSKLQMPNAKYIIEETDEYYLIKLGADYADLRRALAEIRAEGFLELSPIEIFEPLQYCARKAVQRAAWSGHGVKCD